MIRKIPVAEWKKALYQVLTAHIVGYEIHGTIDPFEPGQKSPEQWVEIGAGTCAPSTAKRDVADYRVTTTLHAYCKGQDNQQLNDMLDDIVQSASAGFDLGEYNLPNFICHNVDFAMIEDFEIDFDSGETGLHGVVRITADLQQKTI